MDIYWSDRSLEDYHENIRYLTFEWSEKVALDFIEKVEETLSLLKQYPKMFPMSDYKKVRKAVITKQITLYYLIQKEHLYLVRFWNNHQNNELLDI